MAVPCSSIDQFIDKFVGGLHTLTAKNELTEEFPGRARLYKLAQKEMDSETPGITIEWKESCKRAIIPQVSAYV